MKKQVRTGYMIVQQRPESDISESFRALRANLIYGGASPKVLLITSANASEGKTTVACNLAISLAQANRKVLLMEADMRSPQLGKAFAMTGEGLYDVLAYEGEYRKDIIAHVKPSGLRENLFVLAAGRVKLAPSELLCTQRMAQIMEELRDSFECVIIDSPPVNIYADAAVLSQLADGVIMVLKAGATAFDSAQSAIDALARVKAPMLGAIINSY